MGRRHALIVFLFLLVLVPPVVAVLGAGAVNQPLLQWWAQVLRMFQRPATWRSVRFSLNQAVISALLSVLLAMPGAVFLARFSFPGRRYAQSLTLLPFVMPGLIIILAVISFYGRAGVLNSLLGTDFSLVYSPVGIIIAHVMFNVALAVRIIAEGWRSIDPRLAEISRSLGERGVARFRHLYLPLLTPAIIAAAGIVFLYCFVSFGIVLVFGGVQWATLEVRIYQEMFTSLNLTAAGALALIQLVVCGVVVVLLQRFGDRRRYQVRSVSMAPLKQWQDVTGRLKVMMLAYWTALGLFLLAPLGGIVVRSFAPYWSIHGYRGLITGQIGEREIYEIIGASFGTVFLTSVTIALLSGMLTVIVTLFVARSLRGIRAPYIDALFKVPLAVSGVTFSIGVRLLWGNMIAPLPLLLATQTIMAFPLVFSSLRTTVEAVPIRYLESASSLGASPRRRLWTVEMPVMRGGIINAFVFAVALSLADFTAVLTIARGRIVTFPVAMYRLIGFQSFDAALALGVVYIAVVAFAFLIIQETAQG
jgi:thiamine transport system permease protein